MELENQICPIDCIEISYTVLCGDGYKCEGRCIDKLLTKMTALPMKI